MFALRSILVNKKIRSEIKYSFSKTLRQYMHFESENIIQSTVNVTSAQYKVRNVI